MRERETDIEENGDEKLEASKINIEENKEEEEIDTEENRGHDDIEAIKIQEWRVLGLSPPGISSIIWPIEKESKDVFREVSEFVYRLSANTNLQSISFKQASTTCWLLRLIPLYLHEQAGTIPCTLLYYSGLCY